MTKKSASLLMESAEQPGLQPGNELNHRKLLSLYACAISGRDIDVQSSKKLADKNIGWFRAELAATDGRTVYLPPAQTFEFLKVIVTQQIGHIEFGSFTFKFDRPSTRFRDLRRDLLQSTGQGPAGSELNRFLSFFPYKRLALDIFSVIECRRVEITAMAEYRGLAPLYEILRAQALRARPAMDLLPAPQALLEYMTRLSLGEDAIPAGCANAAEEIGKILQLVWADGATVEDAAEATLRIYPIVSEAAQKEPARRYTPPALVDYRGEFRPELASLLLEMSGAQNESSPADLMSPLTQQQLKQLLQNARSQAPETDSEGLELTEHSDQVLDNLTKELNRRALENARYRPETGMAADDGEGPLDEDSRDTFVYDEWDLSAGAYKSRWCRVREHRPEGGGITFYHQTLHEHAFLAQQIRREFELAIPESYRKEKRLVDGEEYDLDLLVEAVIDLRSGAIPSEKLFWRRNKAERDIAVALLFDMSGSTAEDIGKAPSPSQRSDRSEREGAGLYRSPAYEARHARRRIIDVEKEGIVLLVDVLESLGDRYGIYGFSGNGRENVDFYIIKELEERFSPEVPRRLDSIKPQHATRMGPAIRHATRKLLGCDAKSKFLFLISDGRPQDRGYARARDDREYAVYDTRMALVEARAAAITPFCLTVDSEGNDYLARMMDGLSYEVLADVTMLPLRLAQLYKQLTR